MNREIFLHGRNFFRLCGLFLLALIVFRRLSDQFYLVPLVETSWDPHMLLAFSYFIFFFLPGALATVYFRHSTHKYVRLLSHMLMAFPLVVGGLVLNGYFQGYELLLWTPLLLIRRRGTGDAAGEWLNDLLLRNNLAVDEALRLEWLEKALGSFHSQSEIKLQLLRFIKAEAARQKENLVDIASPEAGFFDLLTYCFQTHPLLSWTAVTVGALLLVGVAAYCLRGEPPTAGAVSEKDLYQVRDDLVISHRALKHYAEQTFNQLTVNQKLTLDVHKKQVEDVVLSLAADRFKKLETDIQGRLDNIAQDTDAVSALFKEDLATLWERLAAVEAPQQRVALAQWLENHPAAAADLGARLDEIAGNAPMRQDVAQGGGLTDIDLAVVGQRVANLETDLALVEHDFPERITALQEQINQLRTIFRTMATALGMPPL